MIQEYVRARERAAENAIEPHIRQVGKLYSHRRAVSGVLTKCTLAEWLDATPETVMQYVRDGRLQVYRPGRNPVFLLEDVIKFITANPEQD